MPVPQEVQDIGSVDELLRYAAAGQLARLLDDRPFLDNGLVGQGAGFAPKSKSKKGATEELSRALSLGFSAKQLIGLDEVVGALASNLESTGGLASLALRLSMEQRERIDVSSLIAHVPPSWTSRLLQDPPADEIGALTQASAVLSAFQVTHKMNTKGQSEDSVRERYREDLPRLVRRLVAVSGAPPTARNYDAQVLLGLLASYSFDSMRGQLERELKYSPLGYRVWRAITKLATLSELKGRREQALRAWVRELLRVSGELRYRSLYPGRALDIELAIAVPAAWSPPTDDWVSQVLLERARNEYATIRERGAAAMGLWERAVRDNDRPSQERVKEHLRELIAEFRQVPGQRPDAPGGLAWIAATLDHVIESGQQVCNDWPVVDAPWYQRVQRAVGELDGQGIPDHLVTGTKNLFLHMILQNAVTYRSLAIETVVTSGWSEPVARALGHLIREEPEAWVRLRAEAALGLLQRPHDDTTRGDLTDACLRAYADLEFDKIPHDSRDITEAERPSRARVTELHTSLFAVGDCFGVPGAEAQARFARDALREVLTELAKADMPRALILRRPARAAAYLLTVTAQPCEDGKDLSRELLEKLRDHPDPVTSRFSKWALGFRFTADGGVKPLLAAAEQQLDDTPFPTFFPR
jgi:hypothetical protein